MRISDWSSDVCSADRSRTGAGDPPLPDRVVRHRRGGAGVVPGTSGAAWIATIRVTPRRARPPSTHRLQKEERPMELGMIGLGKMGANMAQRLVRGGHGVVGFDPKHEARSLVEGFGAKSATSLEELVGKLPAPRVAWMMVPAGGITGATGGELGQ